MALSATTKRSLRRERDRILEMVNMMVKTIRLEDPQEAEWSDAYWAAHVKSSLGDAYGGLGKIIDKVDDDDEDNNND